MLSTLYLGFLAGLAASSHQTGRWASASPFLSHRCGSSSLAHGPSSGRSWSCDYPSAAPTVAPGAPCFGRRTGTCQKRTGPTRCSSASTESGASQIGTGTSAPSSFLPRRKWMQAQKMRWQWLVHLSMCEQQSQQRDLHWLQMCVCTWKWGKRQGVSIIPSSPIGHWWWGILVFLILGATGQRVRVNVYRRLVGIGNVALKQTHIKHISTHTGKCALNGYEKKGNKALI